MSLKWIAGVTAVISLVMGVNRINALYNDWRAADQAAEELLQAARLQQEVRFYEGSWDLVQQALAIRPNSRETLAFQVDLAMVWLREIRVPDGAGFSPTVDPLLPALYRGVSNPDPVYTADVFAHIGWANYLKMRDSGRPYEVDAMYERALRYDPDNRWAHAYKAHWLLNRLNSSASDGDRLDAVKKHIAAALNSKPANKSIVNVIMPALLESGADGAVREAMRVANDIRVANGELSEKLANDVREAFWFSGGRTNLTEDTLQYFLQSIQPSALLATYRWLLDTSRQSSAESHGHAYVIARLTEATGDHTTAVSQYQELLADELLQEHQRTIIESAIDRLSR